jgi:hypothetical protein
MKESRRPRTDRTLTDQPNLPNLVCGGLFFLCLDFFVLCVEFLCERFVCVKFG